MLLGITKLDIDNLTSLFTATQTGLFWGGALDCSADIVPGTGTRVDNFNSAIATKLLSNRDHRLNSDSIEDFLKSGNRYRLILVFFVVAFRVS